MKKLICIMMALLMILSLAACSGSKKTDSASSAVSGASASSGKSSGATERPAAPSSEGVDVDLTKMSSTMVYSEVLNMQQSPDDYYGKIVKMQGPFNVTEIDNNRYYACIIKDATACCSTGIEFVWAGDHTYPDDYPEKNQEITVIGTFNVYTEGNSKYLQLKDADVQF